MKRLSVIGIFLFAAGAVWACCSVGIGANSVFFAGQRNVIVWDPELKMEHFVRQAVFRTEGASLGFIAPSPSIPEFAEADPEIFKTLDATEPPKEYALNSAAAGGVASIPQIVQELDLAGYHIVTLKASDSAGLAKWMKEYGYTTSPTIEAWTKFYIDKGWYLSAFKVASQGSEATTGLIRMSFKTDRPFNPYLVPKDNVPEDDYDKFLGVYFISTGRYMPESSTSNSLAMKWSARLSVQTTVLVAKQLKLASLPIDATVTTFEDHSFPNQKATDDVYFKYSGRLPEPGSPETNTIILAIVGSLIIAGTVWLLLSRRANL